MRLFILSLLCFFTLAAPAFAGNSEKESAYDRVMRTGTLRCAYVATGKYVYKDLATGEIKGAMVDVATTLAESLNLKVEWAAEVGYADFAEGLKTGRYDAFCGALMITPARARVAAFTDPILYFTYSTWGRIGENRFKNVSDINKPDISTATTDGEISQIITKKYFPNSKAYSLPNMTDPALLFTSIIDGKADVVVHDSWNVVLYNAANEKKLSPVFDKPLEVYPAGFAVAPNQQELLNALNVAILSFNNMGKAGAILDKWNVPPTAIYKIEKPFATMEQ